MEHIYYKYAICPIDGMALANGRLAAPSSRYHGLWITPQRLRRLFNTGHLDAVPTNARYPVHGMRTQPGDLIAYNGRILRMDPQPAEQPLLRLEVLGYEYDGIQLHAPRQVMIDGTRYAHADLIAAIRYQRLCTGNAFYNPDVAHTLLNVRTKPPASAPTLITPGAPLVRPVPERGVVNCDGRLFIFEEGTYYEY